MKHLLILELFIILVSYSCVDGDVKRNTIEGKGIEYEKDTLYTDEVLREYKGEFKDHQSSIKFIYSDEKNNPTKGLNRNLSNYLKVVYYSQKFPELNENYKVHLYPVTQNFKYRRITRNKFELQIDQTADIIVFDIYVSCKNIAFKYAKFDKENNLTYISTDEVGLSRFHEPITVSLPSDKNKN